MKSRATRFISVYMRTLVAEHRIRGLFKVSSQTDLIGHRPSGHEQSGFLAGKSGYRLLKQFSSRFMEDVITKSRPGSICLHFSSWCYSFYVSFPKKAIGETKLYVPVRVSAMHPMSFENVLSVNSTLTNERSCYLSSHVLVVLLLCGSKDIDLIFAEWMVCCVLKTPSGMADSNSTHADSAAVLREYRGKKGAITDKAMEM